MMDATDDDVPGIPRKSKASSGFSSKSERCRQDLVDNEDEFYVRPPSGTNHQHPGKHLSIDNRFSELSLDESSWVAESERQSPNIPWTTTKEQHRKKIRQDKVKMPKVNFYVTSPFKQGSAKLERGPVMVVDPSHDLKQQTLAGVARIKKELTQSKRSKQFSRPPSHVQRGYSNPGGYLRPLGRPVTASGPLMRNCQGIIAGARSHRSFTRQAGSGFHRNFLRSCSSARPASPTELLRPESSIHNTSCASSIDEFGNDDEDSFSEDESQGDRIDAVDGKDKSADKKVFSVLTTEDVSEPVESSTRKTNISKKNGCRIYCEGVEDHSDHDDTNNPEGAWTRQSSSHGCYRYGDHGKRPGGDSGANVGNNKVQGKRRNGDNTSYDAEPSQLDKFEEGELSEVESFAICLNCSSADMSHSKHSTLKTCKEGDDLIIETQRVNQQMAMHVSGISHCASERNVNDMRVMTSEIDETLTMPKTRKPVRVVGGNNEASPCTLEYLSFGDFLNGNLPGCDDDHLDSDTLDTDRISSADIFKALDNLNLRMSATEPSTCPSNREGNRRVKSAGHARNTSSMVNSAGNCHKNNRVIGPASAKHGNNKKDDIKCSGFIPNSVTKSVRGLAESLPGYFTQQYKQLVEEEKGPSEKVTSKTRTKSFASTDLPLAFMGEMLGGNCSSETGSSNEALFAEDEYRTNTNNTSFEQLQNSTTSQAELSKGQNRYFDKKNPIGHRQQSHGPASEMFVTMDRKNSLTRTEEDSSCWVDTISCATDCSHMSDNTGDIKDDENIQYTEQNLASKDSITDGSECERQEPNEEAHLEIIAKAKVLSESRCSLQWKQKKTLVPFLPVSFTINAKPPLGQVYYFAYGPEMSVNRMAIYLRREPKTRFWGILFGFRLLFNKKGSSYEAGGFANVEFSPEDSVEGCVYCLTDTQLTMLDNCMGYPKHYTRVVLPVWMLNCTSPSQHGVAQFCVPAVLYIAHDDWVVQDSQASLDCSYAVTQCLKARDILTPNYVQFLCSQASN